MLLVKGATHKEAGASTHKEAARKQGWLTLGSSHAPPNYCYTYRYSAKISDRHKRDTVLKEILSLASDRHKRTTTRT